ncbi:MAG TPA: hypothetical protein VFV46_08945 [Lacibacter sp.]|nr:hypothetical protein [Lacibacter sp.]
MKKLFNRFNWRNFIQRTVLFLLVFIIIRLIVDWIEGDVSLLRVLRLSLIRYVTFALVLGLLDSENWRSSTQITEKEKLPQFKSTSEAFLYYAGVAFFISLLCGIIFLVFFTIQWLVNYLSGKSTTSFLPNWPLYIMVIVVLGISFAGFEAFRNYRNSRKEK